MSSQRSDRPCTLCRRRKVRCDRSLPTCERCKKLRKPCPGYPIRQQFIDQSGFVRDKLGGGLKIESVLSSDARGTLANSDLATPKHDNDTAVPITPASAAQKAALSLSKDPPSTSTTASKDASLHSNLDAVSTAQSNVKDSTACVSSGSLEDLGSEFFDLEIDAYYANENNACGYVPGATPAPPADEIDILDNAQGLQVLISEHSKRLGHDNFIAAENTSAESAHRKEICLLTNLFVELLAPWLDLLDFGAYFTRKMPEFALSNTLVQSAVAAVAAKQTARYVMNGRAGQASKRYAYIMANYENVTSDEWFYKAACYYDRGISQLRAQLQQPSAVVRSALDHAAQEDDALRYDTGTLASHLPFLRSDHMQLEAEHLFSAISVLSLYESLDDCFATPSQHLPGFLALLKQCEAQDFPRFPMSGRAAFWYFARKEALTSYAHHIKSRIDPNCTDVWISSGLSGHVFSFMSTGLPMMNSPQSAISTTCEDDTAHHILIWVLTKVTSFPSASTKMLESSSPSSAGQIGGNASLGSSIDEHSREFVVTWTRLRELLKYWYRGRSCLFVGHAACDVTDPYSSSSIPVRIVFFTSSKAVAVMQLYHFIQILLLINKPLNREDQCSHLRMARENLTELEYHSREILAIALGCRSLAVQRQMSHPLRLAGSYLETKGEREMARKLLRELAADTSSSTDVPT